MLLISLVWVKIDRGNSMLTQLRRLHCDNSSDHQSEITFLDSNAFGRNSKPLLSVSSWMYIRFWYNQGLNLVKGGLTSPSPNPLLHPAPSELPRALLVPSGALTDPIDLHDVFCLVVYSVPIPMFGNFVVIRGPCLVFSNVSCHISLSCCVNVPF